MYINLFKKIVVLSFLFSCGFLQENSAYASTSNISKQSYPSKFIVYQQQGPTCPYIPFVNLEKVEQIRKRENGKIVFKDSDFVTKFQSYAWFFPRIRTLDQTYENLRQAKGAYFRYEEELREKGVKKTERYNNKGVVIEKIDFWSTDQARRGSYTPYNIKIEKKENLWSERRWIPFLYSEKKDQLYFYDVESSKTILIEKNEDNKLGENNYTNGSIYIIKEKQYNLESYKFTNEILFKLNIKKEEIEKFRVQPIQLPILGFKYGYYIQPSSEDKYNLEHFYDVGTYQHMFFACGVNRNNESFTNESKEWAAYEEFHMEMTKTPLNPWKTIDKEVFFEYHLTNIFKNNKDLKEAAMESVNFYNNCWKFYQESFDLYDAPKEPRIKFSDKQEFLPGEDQMLAYLFSSQLRFVWAASIGNEAVIEIEELEEELGKTTTNLLKKFESFPIVPSAKKIIKAAEDPKYGIKGSNYSFLDTWEKIKFEFLKHRKEENSDRLDYVSFSGHGCVISFDEDLIKLQPHENKDVAKRLGFEMWDSLYDKGINPFYRCQGTKDDFITFDF